MARPAKLTEKQKEQILSSVRSGMRVALVAEKYNITPRHIYALLKQSPQPANQVIAAQSNLSLASNGKISPMSCVNCSSLFDRSEDDKYLSFCSLGCFEAYKRQSFPKTPNYSGGACDRGTAEYQSVIIDLNKRYFKPLCWTCDKPAREDDTFCSDECGDIFENSPLDILKKAVA